MSNLRNVVIDAFLDGFTGAGLFGKLRRPGAPTEYVDSRTFEEVKASGEFDATVIQYRNAISEMQADRKSSEPSSHTGPEDDRITRTHALIRR